MTSRETMSVAGVHWTLSPGARSIFSADDLQIANHIQSGRAEVIKHGTHRTVYRVALAGGVVYWKHCRLTPRAWFRDLFRGPKARLEYEALGELSARGIVTIEPLAWGYIEARSPRGSFIITRALDGAVPLDEYLINHPPDTASARRALTLALARYVAAIHNAGVCHPDFHPGNMLIRNQDGEHQFFLIDVHDVQLGDSLDQRARRENLAMFGRWFRMRVDRSDRLRFWREYAGANAPLESARLLECQADSSLQVLLASRDQRCWRENRQFRRVRGAHVGGFAVRGLDPALQATLASDPDEPFRRSGVELLKDSRSSTVCTLDGFVYKRFKVPKWYDSLANLVRRAPALRSWANGHAFRDRFLPTPRPLLVLQRLGIVTTGYVLFERVDNSQCVDVIVANSTSKRRRELTDQLARLIRLMHERGVVHADLKAPNILIDADGKCQFLDLVGARSRNVMPERLRANDLMRLNASFIKSDRVTRTDRLRFLRTYLNWGLAGKEGWKRWWIAVDRATQAKVRRNAKRNRPLY